MALRSLELTKKSLSKKQLIQGIQEIELNYKNKLEEGFYLALIESHINKINKEFSKKIDLRYTPRLRFKVKSFKEKPQSLDDLDPKLLETYKKLGIPLQEQKRLNNKRQRGQVRNYLKGNRPEDSKGTCDYAPYSMSLMSSRRRQEEDLCIYIP